MKLFILKVILGVSPLLLVGLNTFGQQEKRIALVIGVQNYVNVPPLRHSLNDASDMAKTLESKGFRVEALYDPKTKNEIKEAVSRYYNTMRNQTGAVGIIYYAGHGTQYEGENYLIPAAANLQIPGDMEDQCVKMNSFLSVLNSSNNNLNIFLVDACRTNSFPSFSRDIVKGLGAVEPPKGSIVVFATQPGTLASDGTGKNGLFTSKLLKYINEPNLNIDEVFRKVKQEVNTESLGKQLPSVVDNSIGGDFYFDKKESAGVEKKAADNHSINSDNTETPEQWFINGAKFYNLKNYAEALTLYRKAAEAGNAAAQNSLGWMYANGIEVIKDETEAFRWYLKSAEQGNSDGQVNLAWMYARGQGTAKDEAEAVKWIRKSADQKNPWALNSLGWMFENGLGVTKDVVEAVKLYRKSAEQGNAYAQGNLGRMYQNGLGVAKDDAEAVNWYRKAADQGNAPGQNSLGWMYMNGVGVTKDDAEAVKWFRKAADLGNSDAQTSLGYLYLNSRGVSKDDDEAFKLFTKAAFQGNAYAQSNLGYMYQYGRSVKRDYAEAIKWYRKAADQGNAEAQNNLGSMYSNGRGVPTDKVEADRLWRLAAAQGSKAALENLKRPRK